MACAPGALSARLTTAEIEPRHILEFPVFDEDFPAPRSALSPRPQIEQHLGVGHARPASSANGPRPERPAGRARSARLQFKADVR
ncbi:hypothetical protein ACRAWD_08460 [Caulobacter segnis]